MASLLNYACVHTRVTRWGEFQPIGCLLTMGIFLVTKVAQLLCISTVNIKRKNWVGIHFGSFFSQTHLVAVARTSTLDGNGGRKKSIMILKEEIEPVNDCQKKPFETN
jgi:hypothetical protein